MQQVKATVMNIRGSVFMSSREPFKNALMVHNVTSPGEVILGAQHVPSFLFNSKHVDFSVGALSMTASLFSTRENIHWEIYYYLQGSPLRVDISAGDLLWKFTVSLRTPSEMSTDPISPHRECVVRRSTVQLIFSLSNTDY